MTIILWYHESKPFSNLLFFISKMKTRVFKLLNFISEKNSKLKSKQIVNFIFEYFILMTWRSSPLSFFRGFLCHQYGNGLFNVPINGRPVGVVFSGENLNIVWGPLRGVCMFPVWISKPDISCIIWEGGHVTVGILLLYLHFSLSLSQF